MFIGISGTKCSGKNEVARYLVRQGYQQLSLLDDKAVMTSSEDESGSEKSLAAGEFRSVDDMVEYVTTRWDKNFVTSDITSVQVLDKLAHRPFFLHISVDAPVSLRWKRCCNKYGNTNDSKLSLEEFVKTSDDMLYDKALGGLASVNSRARITIVNQSENLESLYIELGKLNLLDETRLRPSWDAYFMQLADLAAHRSNCMKRRVGCVLVRDKRVISTGYNGTPRGLTNCNAGGCKRCNSGNSSGIDLKTCLCLHAEENALLEAGRDRVGCNSVIYCNTCPCLTCSIKIAQTGITEVVYSQSYSMDTATAEIMKHAGIKLRQYSPPSEGLFI